MRFGVLLALLCAGPAFAQSMAVSTVSAPAGSSVLVPVRLFAPGDLTVAQIDLTIPVGLAPVIRLDGSPACEVNPAVNRPGSVYGFLPLGCEPGRDCTQIRAIVISFGIEVTIPISVASEEWLFGCRFTVPVSAAAGSYVIDCGNAIGAVQPTDDMDETIARDLTCTPGGIIVGGQTCEGDLNNDHVVAIDELVRAVSRALGGCPAQ